MYTYNEIFLLYWRHIDRLFFYELCCIVHHKKQTHYVPPPVKYISKYIISMFMYMIDALIISTKCIQYISIIRKSQIFLQNKKMNTIFFKCCPKLIDPPVCTIAFGLAALLFLPTLDFFFQSCVIYMSIKASHISVLIPLGPKPFKSSILSKFALSLAFFSCLFSCLS